MMTSWWKRYGTAVTLIQALVIMFKDVTSGSTATGELSVGDNCTDTVEWCNTTLSRVAECGTNHFPLNVTVCIPVTALEPTYLNIYEVGPTNVSVKWKQKDIANSLFLNYNVTANTTYNGPVHSTVICEATSERTASCSRLSPGYTYTINVTTTYNNTYSAFSLTNESTYPGIPGSLNFESSNLSASNVTLVWIRSSGRVDFYGVIIRQPDQSASVQNYFTFNYEPTIAIKDLDAGTLYNVTVTAYSNDKRSENMTELFRTHTKGTFYQFDVYTVNDRYISINTSIYQQTNESVPGAPVDAKVMTVTDTWIKLVWSVTEKPNGYIQGHKVCIKYKVYIDEPYNNSICEETTKGSITEYNVTNLIAVPGKVIGLRAVTFDSVIEIIWSRPSFPNGDIIKYFVEWLDKRNDRICSVYLTNLETEEKECHHYIKEPSRIEENQVNMKYAIIDLAAHTEYVIAVTAYTSIGAGATSNISIETSVAVPEQVTDVKAEVLNATAVNVSWTVPTYPGPVIYSVITNNMVDNATSNQSCSVQGYYSSSCLVAGLEEYWVYTFSVFSSTDAGNSSYTNSSNVTTEEAGPGPISRESFTMYNSTDNCDARLMKFEWEEPALHDRNSLITKYKFGPEFPYFDVPDPDPYKTYNRKFSKVFTDLKPEHTYTLAVSAQTAGGKLGKATTISFTTGVCAPPDWKDSDLRSVKVELSTESSVTITFRKAFFEQSQQGTIHQRGIIILPKESRHFGDTSDMKLEDLDNWETAQSSSFDTEYRIDIEGTVEEEFVIGKGSACVSTETSKYYCNGPLPNNFNFRVAAYACTRRTGKLLCTISEPFGPFATKDNLNALNTPASSTTIIIVTVVLSFTIVVLATFIVVLKVKLRRIQTNKDKKNIYRTAQQREQPIYENEAFSCNLSQHQDSTDGSSLGVSYGNEESQYSKLDQNTREKMSTYSMIQTN